MALLLAVSLPSTNLPSASHSHYSTYNKSQRNQSSRRVVVTCSSKKGEHIHRKDFPRDFLFGAGTSAVQIEGTEGRGACIWDDMLVDENGESRAADSLHKYNEDVDMLVNMSANVYRFSISWSRILPNGTVSGGINKEGIAYYNKLIDELHKNNIEPFVTLFHLDLPQVLQDEYGGFVSSKSVNDFVNYADICFKEFGNRVKYWATFNEPVGSSVIGYKYGAKFAIDETTMPYRSTHNILLAHAKVYNLYKQKYRGYQKGEIGITMMNPWFLPFSDSPADINAAQRAYDFMVGWFLTPLRTGDYPFTMKTIVRDRLPVFSSEESKLIKGSYDFFTLNYYYGRYAQATPFNPNDIPKGFATDCYLVVYVDPAGSSSPLLGNSALPVASALPVKAESAEDFIYPQGLKDLLLYTKKTYGNPKIYITENGISEKRDDQLPLHDQLLDPFRTHYIQRHLKAIQEAMSEGVNVKGYMAWSLIDGMEFFHGYDVRYGLNYIDYSNDLERIPKNSAKWFGRFMGMEADEKN